MNRAPELLALILVLAMPGCRTVTDRLEQEIFAEALELTMDRRVDLRPPEGLHVTSTLDREIDLAWNPVLVGEVAGYAILRSEDANGPYELAGHTTSRFGTVFSDRGEAEEQLGDGRTYHYRVHPYDREGRVSRSHAYTAATTEPRPDVPKALRTYSNLPRRVVVVWEPSERRSTTGYTVLRSPTVAGPWERVGFVEGRLHTVYEDPVPGDLRVMYYRVVATNRFGGDSDQSEPVRAVTKAEPLPPLTPEVESRSLGRVELAWEPNVEPDIARYEIWRSAASEDGWSPEQLLAEVAPPATRFADEEVGCGQRVRYRLRAIDSDGLTSDYSERLEAEGHTLDLRAESGDDGTVRLAWEHARAGSWPAAQIFEVRGARPDRLLATVSGSSSVELGDLPSGERRLSVVLTDPSAQEPSTSPRTAPPCEISVEIP